MIDLLQVSDAAFKVLAKSNIFTSKHMETMVL